MQKTEIPEYIKYKEWACKPSQRLYLDDLLQDSKKENSLSAVTWLVIYVSNSRSWHSHYSRYFTGRVVLVIIANMYINTYVTIHLHTPSYCKYIDTVIAGYKEKIQSH